MKRAIVTGVAGFVGSTLAERLVADGVEVVGVDALTDYYDPAIKQSNLSNLLESPLFTFENRSLLDDIDDVVDGADAIFHQAGQPGVRPSWGSTFDIYARDNILATQRVLESVRRVNQSCRVVYASSSSVYGDAERYPTKETDRPQPVSPYGVTKLAAEHLVSLYARNFGIQGVSLRYFTVYGPRQRPDMAFTRFITRALNGTPIELYGDGTQIRDFTFIADVVDANVRAATADAAPGSVFNVSGGSSVSVNEVLDVIGQAVGSEVLISRKPKALGDVFRTGGDSTAAQSVLGWSPTVDLTAGIGAQVEWLRPLAERYAPLT